MLVSYHLTILFFANPPLFLARYLVYNLRKRGGDSADKYIKSTEMVAGVKDEVPSVGARRSALVGDRSSAKPDFATDSV